LYFVAVIVGSVPEGTSYTQMSASEIYHLNQQ